jgi:uncharacterized surface protein with fasciclin (FAS1) repeats
MRKILIAMLLMVVVVSGVFARGRKESSAEKESMTMQEEAMKDIVDIASEDGRFSTLVAALEAADLVETLQGDGPFTVFAPTDDAFGKLPDGTVEALLADIPTLKNILLYHVVPGKVMASDVVSLDKAGTVLGEDVKIKTMDNSVMINDAQVVITDIEATNGVIHVIDTVILPPERTASIVDIAVEDGRFETLVAALGAADLVETLMGEGPFTVFAPTDEAFAKLPEGTVENLLKPENKEKLQAVLTYHVVAGKYKAADVVGMNSAKTVNGKSFSITKSDGSVMIDNARIIQTDVMASNGVIHVIDEVILPR